MRPLNALICYAAVERARLLFRYEWLGPSRRGDGGTGYLFWNKCGETSCCHDKQRLRWLDCRFVRGRPVR